MGHRQIKNKFTNARVNREFNEELSKHPLFRGDSNYKLIAPCHYLLNAIHKSATFNELEYVQLYHKYIQNKFSPYKVNYRPYIQALLDLDLLEIKQNAAGAETYLHAENKEDSMCKQYRVTAKCAKMLDDDNKEYLRRLHNDPQIKRHVRRNKGQNYRRLNTTGDLVIDNTFENLFRLKYEKQDAEKMLNILSAPPADKDTVRERQRAKNRVNNAQYSLIDINEGNFEVVRYDKDGRIHNTWTLMNSNLRQIFHIHCADKILVPTHTIDIRAAHPTFFGIYLKNLYLKHYYNHKYYNNNYPLHSSFLYTHYATDIEASFKRNLFTEVERWNELWTNPSVDPRDDIASTLGITKQNVKDLLNSAINDARNKNKLHIWIQNNFPFLYSVWIKTAINETGCNISRLYESRIFRDNGFLAFVHCIKDIRVMDEHDGLSVFTDFGDKEAAKKVEQIKQFLVNSCHSKFAIKPVIKIKILAQFN